MKKSIQEIMSTSPQIWTTSSIIYNNFGEILLSDDQRACLHITSFYFIEGPFLESFGRKLLSLIKKPLLIISSNLEWYTYFFKHSPIPLELESRRMYSWSGSKNVIIPFLHTNSPYQVKPIGPDEAYQMENYEWAEGVFDSYGSIEKFIERGFGFCLLHNKKIISLCVSFAHSDYGVEIEVDTDPNYQGQGCAKIVSAHFVLESLRRGLKPLWDSSNIASDKVAKAIRFEFVKEYEVLGNIYDD